MKQEYNNIDDLLRGSLEGYQKKPSPGVWKRIAWSLLLGSKGSFFALILLAVAAGSIIGMQLLPTSGKEQLDNKAVQHAQPVQASQQSGNRGGMAGFASNTAVDDKDAQVAQLMEDNPIFSSTDEVNEKNRQKQPLAANHSNDPAYDTGISPGKPNHFEVYPGLEQFNLSFATAIPFKSLYLSRNPYSLNGSLSYRSEFSPPLPKADYGFARESSLIIQLGPEYIFSENNSSAGLPALNLDVSYLVEGRGGFLQAGAGLGLNRGQGLYDIRYAQYDSIGYYEEVQSFYIDPVTGHPAFITTTEGVFDTIPYATEMTNTNRTLYLRIPVAAGLKFYEHKRLAFYLEMGATYSLLIDSYEPGINYQNPSATWIEVIDNSPSKLQSNLQLSIGPGLKYKINNRMGLRLDAWYNYYWETASARQSGEQRPFSVSLKAGLIFKL